MAVVELIPTMESRIRESLNDVIDPHMNVSLNDMGMIRQIDISAEGDVLIGMALPCSGCPALKVMENDVQKTVGALPGVKSVRTVLDWSKPWDRSEMSQAAKDNALTHGYRI